MIAVQKNNEAHQTFVSCEAYLDLISVVNEMFGTNGWSHSVTRQDVDFVECIDGRYSVGAVAFVRVQLQDGTFHEEMGYGMSHDVDHKGVALFTARKEAIRNGLRGALHSFGGPLSAKVDRLESPENPKPQGASRSLSFTKQVVWTNTTSNKLATPIFKRSEPVPDRSEAVTPVAKTATNVSEEEAQRLERIERQRRKQEEFKKKLQQKQVLEPSTSANIDLNWPAEESISNEWDNLAEELKEGDSLISAPDLDHISFGSNSKPIFGNDVGSITVTHQLAQMLSSSTKENRISPGQKRVALSLKRNITTNGPSLPNSKQSRI
uniref:DNA repair protein RAD52-like protein n=2 Tax=Timema TaxID=61471 RepID=A0A7R9IJF1_9NEOP|nr:unnamed protein product [Timema bartmani]CAD7459458.1 unnamed protein product [Timema tahoe]